MHSTATPGVMTAEWFNRWNKSYKAGEINRQVCVHAFVDDEGVYQYLPWNHRGWHAGGNANNTHIGFELCEPSGFSYSTGANMVGYDVAEQEAYFRKTWQNAIELCVMLCQKFGLSERDIICHSEGHKRGIASNHADVLHWFPKHGENMDTFRTAVKAELNKGNSQAAEVNDIAVGDVVAIKLSADKYYPGGPIIPAWVKRDTFHKVTELRFREKPVIKGGKQCVLLGKKVDKKTGEEAAGIMTWVDKDILAVISPSPEKPAEIKKYYRVQVGALSKKENAEATLKKLKKAGFDVYKVRINGSINLTIKAFRVIYVTTKLIERRALMRVRIIAPTEETKETKKRVCAYARVSSEHEKQGESLENQISYYERYIKANPEYEFAGVFADRGISGTIENRPWFKRMLELARQGDIDLIITKSISRFARNTAIMLQTVRELREIGVEVRFEKENINTLSGDGELMLTVLSSFAQEESKNVSDNLKWRVKKKFERGELIINTTRFLGYDKDDNGNLVINQNQAKVVKRIFNDYLEGKGVFTIAKELNADGISTVAGGRWHESTVLNILKNEKYKGDAILQKYYTPDHLKKGTVPNNGQVESYYIEDNHQPIVTKEMWEAVSVEMKLRAEAKGIKGNTLIDTL